MTKGKFEMELLNSEELKGVTGGLAAACSKAGDTVYKKCIALVGDIVYVLCATVENTCPGTFSMNCGVADVNCSNDYKTRCLSGF